MQNGAAHCRFGLHARARSTALGRRRAPACVRLSDSLGMVRDVIVVTAPVTPGSSRTSSSGTTRELGPSKLSRVAQLSSLTEG